MSDTNRSILAALSAARLAVTLRVALISSIVAAARGGGYDTGSQLSAIAGYQLRRGIFRTARLTVDTLDLTATYTITLPLGATIPSAAYDANAGGAADLADVLAGIVAAVEGDAPSTAVVAVVADATGIDVTWRARVATGITTAATGTGDLACEATPETATALLYSRLPTTIAGTSDEAANLAISEAAGAWESVWLGAAPLALALTDGQGWRESIDAGGYAGFAWITEALGGHADDGGTVTLKDPAAYVARSTDAAGA